MYLDRVKITIKAGNGGGGCASFYRSKMTMNGGPDGGDGGKGGDVIFRASPHVSTLQAFQFKKKFVAENGSNGMKKMKSGADGKNIIVEVPLGTVIYDADSEKIIADLTEENQQFIALRGGVGGKGNTHFATPTRQAPKFCQTGEETKERMVILELKTIADVGLIGYPNAGKSTLLSVVSNARPKIANYQFTTLYPNLGVVNYYENSFVVADIPGLIEGASEGAGLGYYFLKHIERVRLLVHLVDIAETDGRNAVEDFHTINNELKKYSEKLSKVKQIVVLTKCDCLSKEVLENKVNNFEESTKIKPILISSISNYNLDLLKKTIFDTLKTIEKPQPLEIEKFDFDVRDKTSINIAKISDDEFEISGGYIDNLSRGVVLSDYVSFSYFQKRLKDDGIIDMLKGKGLKNGNIVHIKDITFEYFD